MRSIAAAKTELRQSLTLARNLQHALGDQELAIGFARQLIALCNDYSVSTIAAYLSFGTEPDTTEFLAWARASELQVMLPISRTDGELDWVYQSNTETTPGIFGFAEAVGEAANFSDAQLIILPALAVDLHGNRLGKGKGFYDRSLDADSAVPRFAVIYDSEVVDELPHEPHDVSVTGFVTQSRTHVIQG